MNNLAIDTGPVMGLVKYGVNNHVDSIDFWEMHTRSVYRSPEHELFKAVLEQGIEFATLSVNPRKNYKVTWRRRIYKDEARKWIADRSDWWIFSFARCCEVLDIDPDWLRKGIEARY